MALAFFLAPQILLRRAAPPPPPRRASNTATPRLRLACCAEQTQNIVDIFENTIDILTNSIDISTNIIDILSLVRTPSDFVLRRRCVFMVPLLCFHATAAEFSMQVRGGARAAGGC